MKKYELLADDTIELNGIKLYCIRAERDFGDVKAGNLGGYIQKESNISHEGNGGYMTKRGFLVMHGV